MHRLVERLGGVGLELLGRLLRRKLAHKGPHSGVTSPATTHAVARAVDVRPDASQRVAMQPSHTRAGRKWMTAKAASERACRPSLPGRSHASGGSVPSSVPKSVAVPQ